MRTIKFRAKTTTEGARVMQALALAVLMMHND